MQHRRLFRLALILPCWLLAGVVSAGTGSDRVDEFLAGMRTFTADFEQTVYDENLQPLETSTGNLFLERPGRFRWDYLAPAPQTIVADGSKVWIYDSELEQVTVRTLDSALGNTPALLLSSDRPVSESFTVKELGAKDGLLWVELVPRATDATFTKMRLGFGGEDLAVMDLVDNFGQTTQIRFSSVVKNSTLDPGLFSFTPPEGVDVITDTDN